MATLTPAQTSNQPLDQSTVTRDALILLAAQQASSQLVDRVKAMLVGAWNNLGSWREPDIEKFVTIALKVVMAGIGQQSLLTSASLQRYGAAIGADVQSARVSGYVRSGVKLEEVYARPFHDVWTALHNGDTIEQAVKVGADRIATVVATDMQLAKTQTAQAAMSGAQKIVGYRRVLEGSHSCGLCIVASTRLYHVEDLMPIHPNCDCGVEIVTGKHPGPVLNLPALQAVHAAINDTFGADSPAARIIPGLFHDGTVNPALYRDVILTHEHGEIGPVLGLKKPHRSIAAS